MRRTGNRVGWIALSCIAACVESNPAFDSGSTTDASGGSETGSACPGGMICVDAEQVMLFDVEATDIAVGRIDDDSLDDLLIGFEGGAAVLFSADSHALPLAMQPLFTSYNVAHVHVADIDGDGDGDAIGAAQRQMPHRVDVRKSDGDRSFAAVIPLALTVASDNALGVTALRIDDNDSVDIALAVEAGDMDNVSYWLANGDEFGTRATLPVVDPRELLAIPIDAARDMLVVATSDGIVTARYADNTWSTTRMLIGNDAVALASGDVDGDGDEEVFVALGDVQGIAVFEHGDNGTLVALAPIMLTAVPDDLATGDMDGDGHIDVAITHATAELTILRGPTLDPIVVPLSSPAGAVALADLDDDGRDDVVLAMADGSIVLRRAS